MRRRRDETFPDNGFEAWGGYMQAKVAKLEDQFCAESEKEGALSHIFRGVSIYVNGFTDPPADELKNLMAKHGGVYHTYQKSDDFIIASNLPDTKVKNMALARVVRPEWITESISSHRLLDYRDYLLYKNSRNQRQLNFVKKDLPDLFGNIDRKSSIDNVNQVIDTVSNELWDEIEAQVNIEIKNDRESSRTLQISHSTKTSADPNFISEFYNNSRLHHISQLGGCFKQHVNDMREQSVFKFPARVKLKETLEPYVPDAKEIKFEKGKKIMHIDMDCFFVSVGLRNRPELRGKPVAVTHSKGGQARPKRPGVDRKTEFYLYRSKQAHKLGKAAGIPKDEIEFESRVDHITDEDDKYGSMSKIASCSYEARAKGVGNGMFMGTALKLCPDICTIPYDFEGYKEVAYTLYNTIAQYTLDIEAVSCDEMYVDCTELLKDMGISANDFATAIRNEIKSKTGCPCSTGFGGNRLQARLATKKAKPDGQFFLTEDLVEDFMFDIKLKDLPGVGRQISQKLESLGHTTCGSLQQMSLAALKCQLGVKTGTQLFDQCRGKDANPLTFETVRKSVSAEVNYGIRFENNDQCYEFLKQLSAEVSLRMQQFKVIGKCVTLKLMVRAEEAPVETAKFMGHGFCNVINKSTSLSTATGDVEVIVKEVISIFKKLNIDPNEMRGVGIQITKLESTAVKLIKGAMSKFLNLTKPLKSDAKNESPKKVNADSSKYTQDFNDQYLSPKKPKIELSPKKSPIIAHAKSPVGKRRGRPPKNAKYQQSSSNHLMNKFLQGHNVPNNPYKDPMVKIERTSKTLEVKVENPSTSKELKHTIDKPKGLIGLPWKEVRELLRAWLDSGQAPLPCDIKLISAYMQEMVVNKNLEKTNILVKFLRRNTKEMGNHEWIEMLIEK
ncbi:putative terminal deoxycytidyl transferase rev1 [Operophtera brumata]|uniref:DNA repair protein REV1 n=1 Tax=Operophtera brumata TaxID=104452 RepID=A0A0L7LTL5_OPEBR|nr:putative terminal deoxycytidyl transferase rev1 [Operophtera brumata]